ncbi:LysR substrate-binding domain-containing protein [Nocardia inohanensis]|uniref:LysR substrate-binding domain-containing protein n=1 Tax=Nocardia inohanensis TaxID=209246 RepID=UPI000A003A31
MSQDHIESALLADELDIGIAFAGQHLPGLTPMPLFVESLSLVVGEPGRDGLDTARPMSVAHLERLPLALLTADFATRIHIDAYFAREAVTPRIIVQANSIQALTEIVWRTALATVLPDAITRTRCDLVPIALDPPLPPRRIVLLVRENGYRSAAARAFIALAEEVAARLATNRD